MNRWRILALAGAVLAQACGESAICGDGVLATTEECEDGNTHGGDGCSLSCTVEQGYDCGDGLACDPICNDGLVVDAEVCDPSSPDYTEYCSADCMTMIASCGDGTIQPAHEACDDGDPSGADGCNSQCQASLGWECDASGVCDATQLDPSLTIEELTEEQRLEFCTWVVSAMGGAGEVHYCGGINYTVNTPSQCASAITGTGAAACTVGDWEAWTGERRDPCDFFSNTAPVC